MKKPSPSESKKVSKTTPCCSKVGIKRGPWTPEEDELLAAYIKKDGEGRWRTLPKRAGLLRCGKSCRLRWMNYLRPCVKRGRIAPDEEDLILRLHRLLGNRWSLIAGRIPGRTDNEIKNYWNTHLSKKLISQGIDPRTHKPLINPNPTSTSSQIDHQNYYSNPITNNSFQLEKPYRVVATKVSGNFTMTHLDDQYQNKQGVNQNGNPNLPSNFDGFGQSNVEDDDHFMINSGTGNDQDTFSSFLDSLINENVFGNQQLVLQPGMVPTSSSVNPAVANSGSAQIFNHNSVWDAELFSSMAALGDHDQTAL